MAYFPKVVPFYEPHNEHQLYEEEDGRSRLRVGEFSRGNDQSNGNNISIPNSNRLEGWNDTVQGNQGSGRLFYTDTSDNAPFQGQQQQNESTYHNNHSRQASYQSVGSYHSNNSDSPRQQFHRQSSHGSYNSRTSDKNHSTSAAGNHNNQPEQLQKDSAFRHNDQSYASFSRHLHTHSPRAVPPRPAPRVKNTNLNVNTKNTSVYSHSGKRKSVYMHPKVRNVTSIDDTLGVELCEKLFGIKLCHYKQKPPRPNGASVDQVLRDRKIIVQGVVQDSQADICALINRGDMLVGLNDNDLTWVNIDDMLRQAAQLKKVKLTFQVPVVVGPKSATPPLTPTRMTPPLTAQTPPPVTSLLTQTPPLSGQTPPPVPPHVPLRSLPPTPPPRPPAPHSRATQQQHQHNNDLIFMTTGETSSSLSSLLSRYLFTVMYLTFSGQSENSKDDIIYQYPDEDNKLVDLRGVFLTLGALLPDVTGNIPKMTTINYRNCPTHVIYWKVEQDMLVMCLPEKRVPSIYLKHIFTDLLQLIQVLHGSVQGLFRDGERRSQLNELVSLTLYRVLQTGVQTQAIPHCSPLEPILLDSLTGVRWLQLSTDNKISCDEILNEFEAQDFSEFEDFNSEERRKYGIVGSCLFYRDYLLCSHLCPELLQDVHLYLKYNCILHLVSTQPTDELVLWREIYPTHLCQTSRSDLPGYREPTAKWFLLVVSLRHFLLCTILEAGSYSLPVKGWPVVDEFLTEQSKVTLSQLDIEDTDMELQCNERLFSMTSGPSLRCIDSVRNNSYTDNLSPTKSTPSPRYGHEDVDRLSVQTPNGAFMKRQGSKLSYGSNDSSGSSNSLTKVRHSGKKGVVTDVDTMNRSFSRDSAAKSNCDIKLTRGLHNQLLHYVNCDRFECTYVAPTPWDLAAVQGVAHQHLLFNFYACCLRIHETFEVQLSKKRDRSEEGDSGGIIEEGVMFTCVLAAGESRRQPTSAMYWVIGRRMEDGQEMFVCLEDGTPQSLVELAFAYKFGMT